MIAFAYSAVECEGGKDVVKQEAEGVARVAKLSGRFCARHELDSGLDEAHESVESIARWGSEWIALFLVCLLCDKRECLSFVKMDSNLASQGKFFVLWNYRIWALLFLGLKESSALSCRRLLDTQRRSKGPLCSPAPELCHAVVFDLDEAIHIVWFFIW